MSNNIFLDILRGLPGNGKIPQWRWKPLRINFPSTKAVKNQRTSRPHWDLPQRKWMWQFHWVPQPKWPVWSAALSISKKRKKKLTNKYEKKTEHVHIYEKKAVKSHPVPQMSMGGLGGTKRKHGHDLQKSSAMMNLHSEHSKTENKMHKWSSNVKGIHTWLEIGESSSKRGKQNRLRPYLDQENQVERIFWFLSACSHPLLPVLTSEPPPRYLAPSSFKPCSVTLYPTPCFYLPRQAITSSPIPRSASMSSSTTTMAGHTSLPHVPCGYFHA